MTSLPVELAPEGSQPGLWVNRNWQPGTAGIFAVVIGVSDYEHLPDPNDENVRKPYGLTKLAVSALTALRIFEWLRNECFIPGCPLAKCWALLSPTLAERQFDPQFAEHTTFPTFANCQNALRSWHRELESVSPEAAKESRTFFFFSGHGLQVLDDHHVVLPSDWLENGIKNDAVSVQNLWLGLAGLYVSRQFFFIDACRGDHDALCGSKIAGQRVLDEPLLVRGTNPERVAPILHATSAGQSAWQNEQPAKGLSLFGHALREGLCGAPQLQVEHTQGRKFVKLYPLQVFVEDNVRSQLDAANFKLIQPVRLGGSTRNETVTVLR